MKLINKLRRETTIGLVEIEYNLNKIEKHNLTRNDDQTERLVKALHAEELEEELGIFR